VKLGLLSMWFPAINVNTGEQAWRNVSIPQQICQTATASSLLSTAACQGQGMLSYFDQRCAVLPGGWVIPFAGKGGFYMDVIYAPVSTPPSASLLPTTLAVTGQVELSHVLWQVTKAFESSTLVPLLGRLTAVYAGGTLNLAVRGNNQSVAASAALTRLPKMTPEETQAWRMQGFPFAKQWRWAYAATTGHGLKCLPTAPHLFTDPRVTAGRMRSLPFHAVSSTPRATKPGQLVHMDFQLCWTTTLARVR
jgi:hypothetical protein